MRWTEFYGDGAQTQNDDYGTGHFVAPDWHQSPDTPDPDIASLMTGDMPGTISLAESGLYLVTATLTFGWAMDTSNNNPGNDVLPDTMVDIAGYLYERTALS